MSIHSRAGGRFSSVGSASAFRAKTTPERGFESRCRKYGGKNSSEVELRHIEVVNGWYTVRVLLHVT